MIRTLADAVAVEQSAFFEDEFYYEREDAFEFTESEIDFIDQYSMAHTWYVMHTLPHVLH